MIALWYDLHGRNLKSSKDTQHRLIKLAHQLNNPVPRLLTASDIAHYRKIRLGQDINSATLNRELVTLKALFRELKRLAVIDYESPIMDIRKLREVKSPRQSRGLIVVSPSKGLTHESPKGDHSFHLDSRKLIRFHGA